MMKQSGDRQTGISQRGRFLTLQSTDKKHLEIFDILRFPLIVCIVFIHSYHPSMENMDPVVQNVWHFIKDGVASVAVPAFFFISGYLFFYGKTWTWKFYGRQLLSRIFTIAFPYVIWTFFYWTLMFTTGHLPEPTLPQFWYLHELMFLALISPVFHYLHKRAYASLAVFATVWLLLDWRLNFYVLTSMMPILFFYAGTVLAVKRLPATHFTGWSNQYGRAFVGLAAMYLWLGTLNWNTLLLKAGMVSGVVAALWLASKVQGKWRAALLGLSGSSFFVFAFHEPLIKFLFSDMFNLYQPKGDAVFALYIVSAVVILYASVSVYRTLRWFAPGFTNFITGGRS